MKIEIISPDKLNTVYSFIISLSSQIAKGGKAVMLIDFTSGSLANKKLEKNYESGPLKGYYHEKVGDGTVYYASLPITTLKPDEIRALIEIFYREISSINTEIKVILFPMSMEIIQQTLQLEREVFKKILGPERSRPLIALGIQRVIVSNSPESPVIGVDTSDAYVVLLYEPSQADAVSAYEWKFKKLVEEGKYAGYSLVLIDNGIPYLFSEVKKYDGMDKIVDEFLKEPKSEGSTIIRRIPENFENLVIEGSAFSIRSEIVNSLISVQNNIYPVLLNAGSYRPPNGVRELRLMPGFSDERFSAKNVADVKAMAKRLAEEVIKETKRSQNVLLVIYDAGNITPRVAGYDDKVIANEFWKTFISHLKYNLTGLRIIIVCDPSIETCSPIEPLSDIIVLCKGKDESEIEVKVKRA